MITGAEWPRLGNARPCYRMGTRSGGVFAEVCDNGTSGAQALVTHRGLARDSEVSDSRYRMRDNANPFVEPLRLCFGLSNDLTGNGQNMADRIGTGWNRSASAMTDRLVLSYALPWK